MRAICFSNGMACAEVATGTIPVTKYTKTQTGMMINPRIKPATNLPIAMSSSNPQIDYQREGWNAPWTRDDVPCCVFARQGLDSTPNLPYGKEVFRRHLLV